MYVCLCNPTIDKQIENESKKVESIDDLKDSLKICQNCKRCSKEIDNIFYKTN